jgi:signal transduction histidine kinase
MKLRTRIALALALSFVIAGVVVLAVSALTYRQSIYDSPSQQTDDMLERIGATREQALAYVRANPDAVFDGADLPTPSGTTAAEAFRELQREAKQEAVARAWRWSAVALVVTALAAAVIGWLVAGRALRPLRAITARARAASATDLSRRVALDGPNDEIHELGDTFDDMLARLDQAFTTQRRFSAQVSHELRTPLAVIASETEMLLARAPADERHSLEQIREATDRAERMITALLVLSRSGSGDLSPADVDLDAVTGDVLGELVNGPAWRELRVDLDLEPAPVHADPALLERLVTNLLTNAARHNRPGGWAAVRTRTDGEWSVLEVENSVAPGAPLPGAGGAGDDRGGIGLTVVEAVVAAHGGSLDWSAIAGDGVRAVVRFPRRPTVVVAAAAGAFSA